MQFGPTVRQRETSRVWFPSLPLSSIYLSSPTWLVSCMFVMSSTQKGAFSIYINAGVRPLARPLAHRRALKRESSRLVDSVLLKRQGARGVRKALFSLVSALRGAFFLCFLFAGVRARPFKANYEDTHHGGPAAWRICRRACASFLHC